MAGPESGGDRQGKALARALDRYRDRKFKIGSFTACSNVTGLITPYGRMAALMHRYGGLCFVDFAASAPYVPHAGTRLPAFRRMNRSPGSVCVNRFGLMRESEQVMNSVSGDWP